MLSSAVIVFREVLEAALVITIVMAATQGAAKRAYWIFGGIGLGVLGAMLVATLAGSISQSFEGAGQELFNAGILFTAVLMLAWHNIWMSSHAKELVNHLKRLSHGVVSGELPMYFLCTAIALAVLREGSEIVLFIYGMSAGGSSAASIFSGSILGLAGGGLLGALLYKGLITLNPKHLFTVTGWLILLLASGMAASGAGDLIQAGYFTSQMTLWNTSNVVSQQSALGQLLHVLIGYQDRPTSIQLGFYIFTLICIGGGMHIVTKQKHQHKKQLENQGMAT